MSRGLHADVITELAKGTHTYCHLVQMQWDSADGGTDYLTDAQFDITDGADTYTSSAFLLGVPSVSESARIDTGDVTLELGGSDQTYISLILGGAGYMDRKVVIKRAWLDSSNAIIGSTATIYHGRISGYAINEDESTSVIEFDIANHWTDFKRVNGRRTNDADQQRLFPGDRGFEFCGELAQKTVKWGMKTGFLML